jgi:hypothetical protein
MANKTSWRSQLVSNQLTAVGSGNSRQIRLEGLLVSLKTPVDASNANLFIKSGAWANPTGAGGNTSIQFVFNQPVASGTTVFVHWWSPGGTDLNGIGKTNYWTYNIASTTPA